MNVTLIGMGSGQPESLTLQSLAAGAGLRCFRL